MTKRTMTPDEILQTGGAIGLVVPAELRTPERQKAARIQEADPNVMPGGPFVVNVVTGHARKATALEAAVYAHDQAALKRYAVVNKPAAELAKQQAKAAREKLELAMLQQLKAVGNHVAGMRNVEQQYKFKPGRQWRLDFAWPAKYLALEVDGGTFTGGRHVRGEGYAKDCEKHAQAMLMGYRVFRATAEQVKDGTAVKWIEQAIKGVYE